MIKDKSEQIAEFGQTAKHSIVEGPWDTSDASPARQYIDKHVVDNGQPFPRGLRITNKTLASNINGSLGYNQALVYVSDSRMDWSNSYQFFRSALRWGKKAWRYGRADAAAGMVFNGASAFLASGTDHANRISGKALYLTGDAATIRQ
ncbi:hypothetical protein CCOS865_03504 [Pseudomonas reidholzensis]|uniref:Uncharacterized protein n=2 Tax=Pseudomonas reidholzensis TaxID=1785162 RepID=A0A383RWG2_9PSED|nr:hypothetical protein CCOS865_03504 [Pseudomonas reidholzensis]